MADFQRVQTLEFANITSACPLTPKLVCLGHSSNSLLSLVAWTGSQYTMISKSNLLAVNARQRFMAFSEIRKDTFSKMPNQIFVKQEHIEDPGQSPALYRVLLDPKNLAESFKVQLRLTKEEPLMEWRQVSDEITVMMQKTAATVTRIDPDSNSYTLSVVELFCLPKGLVLVPGFESDVMPLALSLDEEGFYKLTDVRGKGWHGSVDGLDDVEVLG